LEDRRVLSTFTVKNVNDSGPDSLRDVITRLNSDTANPNPDVIAFAIPATGVQTISLLSDLPAITHPVTVNGASQSHFTGTPLIVLDGTNDASGFGTGMTLDATAGAMAFKCTIQNLELTNFNTGIDDLAGSQPLSVILTSNDITATNSGIGVDFFGGTGALTATMSGNHIHADTGGIGIDFYRTGAVTATLVGNTVSGDGGGFAIDFFRNLSVTATIGANNIEANGGGFGINISDSARAVRATVSGNQVTADNGGFGIDIDHVGRFLTASVTNNQVTALGGGFGAFLQGGNAYSTMTVTGNTIQTDTNGIGIDIEKNSGATRAVVTIEGNTLTSSGMGTGLFLNGGPGFEALVQANQFSNNLVGVSVNGNGTTAGTIDLGGGSLGSSGGNDFKSFKSATATSYAIGLFSVASSYNMDALSNLFTVDPAMVIADGSHDTTAGGSGTIVV
jgi:hypothetical protein